MTTQTQLAEVQLQHSWWSTRKILESCAALPHESFVMPFEIGEGSLHAVLSHVLECMTFFADVLEEHKYAPGSTFSWTQPEGFAENASTATGQLALINKFGPAQCEAGIALLERKGPGGLVWWPNFEKLVPASVSIAQVIDHTSYHRAQCNNMLRHVGAQPLDVDPHIWGKDHGLRQEP
jgi:uncharacterized damage-inducible protein DinB